MTPRKPDALDKAIRIGYGLLLCVLLGGLWALAMFGAFALAWIHHYGASA